MRYKAIENKGYPYTTMGYPDHVNALVVTYNKPYEAVVCACYNIEIAEDIANALNGQDEMLGNERIN